MKSRYVRINDIVILTNFKCMFSSINKLPITEYNPVIINNHYTCIFLYRCYYKRCVSCFLNWAVFFPERDQQNIENGWLINILENQESFDMNQFKNLLKDYNKNIIALFKMYVDILPNIIDKNPHLHPQIDILNKKRKKEKIKIDKYINIDDPNHIKELEHCLKLNIPNNNSSNKTLKKILLDFINSDNIYKDKINTIYMKDQIFIS